MDRVERRIDELFAESPGDFVRARDALVRELKQDGEKTAAARVRALKRPTVAAWALNRVARREPDLVGNLVAAGERLRHAHAEALAGKGSGALREARTRERDALVKLLRAVREELEREGYGPTHLESVRDTLSAIATADPDLVERLEQGRLTGELEPAGIEELFAERELSAEEKAEARAAEKRRAAEEAREARAARKRAAREAQDAKKRAAAETRAEKKRAAADERAARKRAAAQARAEKRRAAQEAKEARRRAAQEAKEARRRAAQEAREAKRRAAAEKKAQKTGATVLARTLAALKSAQREEKLLRAALKKAAAEAKRDRAALKAAERRAEQAERAAEKARKAAEDATRRAAEQREAVAEKLAQMRAAEQELEELEIRRDEVHERVIQARDRL